VTLMVNLYMVSVPSDLQVAGSPGQEGVLGSLSDPQRATLMACSTYGYSAIISLLRGARDQLLRASWCLRGEAPEPSQHPEAILSHSGCLRIVSQAGGTAQAVEYLLCKCEALSSNASTAKKKKYVSESGWPQEFLSLSCSSFTVVSHIALVCQLGVLKEGPQATPLGVMSDAHESRSLLSV
jgi:hypothetical protein